MDRTQNLAWFSRLACLGSVVFTIFELSGGPYTGRMKSYVVYVCTVINKDRRSTDSKTARRLGISYGISQGVFEYAMDLREFVCVFSKASRTTSFFGRCSVGVASNISFSVALAPGNLFCLR
jgi:hypothetical protein